MFSNGYGFVVDYLAEILRSLRNHDYSDRYKEHFSLSSDISTRDRDGINKTFSGLMKILFPHGEATKEEIEELLRFAIEGRKRVKDQLMRIDSTYGNVRFAYLDDSRTRPNLSPHSKRRNTHTTITRLLPKAKTGEISQSWCNRYATSSSEPLAPTRACPQGKTPDLPGKPERHFLRHVLGPLSEGATTDHGHRSLHPSVLSGAQFHGISGDRCKEQNSG